MEIKKIDKDLEFLRQVSQEVNFKEDLTSEIEDLEKYVLETQGFAVATIQLGYKNRVVYVRCSDYTKYDEEDTALAYSWQGELENGETKTFTATFGLIASKEINLNFY